MSVRKQKVYKSLTLSQKCEILKALKRGRSISCLSRRFDVSKSAICGIKRSSKQILRFLKQTEIGFVNKKTLKSSETPKTEEALFKWLCRQRERNTRVTIALLCAKAKWIHEKLQESAYFNPGRGWLNNFKRRHGIRTLRVTREKFPKKLHRDILKDRSYVPDQIYRADETALFWRVLPGRITEQTALETRSHYERLTFLACTNVNGTHKLKPLVIGSTYDPRVFKGFEHSIVYKFSRNARMTPQIFREWFSNCFVDEVSENLRDKTLSKRAILLLDNSVCRHPPVEQLISKEGNIRTMLLPSSVILDQTVIDLVRLEYKKRLLSEVVSANCKRITLRSAIVNIRLAWDTIKPSAIKNCWKKMMHDDEHFSVEDYTPLAVLRSDILSEKISYMEIKTLVNCMPGGKEVLETELNSWLTSDNGVTRFDGNPDAGESFKSKVLHSKAVECFNTLIDWAQQNEVGEKFIVKLFDLKDLILVKNMTSAAKD